MSVNLAVNSVRSGNADAICGFGIVLNSLLQLGVRLRPRGTCYRGVVDVKSQPDRCDDSERSEDHTIPPQIGRASCRERVYQYVYLSEVAVTIKKKKIIY